MSNKQTIPKKTVQNGEIWLTFVENRRITFGQDFKRRVKVFRSSPINGTPVGPITPSLIFMHLPGFGLIHHF